MRAQSEKSLFLFLDEGHIESHFRIYLPSVPPISRHKIRQSADPQLAQKAVHTITPTRLSVFPEVGLASITTFTNRPGYPP